MDGDLTEASFETKLASFANQDGIDYATIVREYLVDSSGRKLVLSKVDELALLSTLDRSINEDKGVDLVPLAPAVQLGLGALTSADWSYGGGNMPEQLQPLSDQINASTNAIIGSVAVGTQALASQINELNRELTLRIDTVNTNLQALSGKTIELENALMRYIEQDARDKAIQLAETRRVAISQDLEQKYGHNKRLRRTAVGILQATDLAIVRTESVVGKSEDLMLESPNYWLAPALVSLSAWINDDPVVAKRAVTETVKRDRQKAALFYALVNRRANRYRTANAWLEGYLGYQRADSMDYKVVILLNAYANGLFGADADGAVMSQLTEWLDEISATPAARRAQVASWQKHFNNVGVMGFVYELNSGNSPLLKFHALRRFCSGSWPAMAECFGATCMNDEVMKWAKDAVETRDPQRGLKGQVDHLLEVLVSDFEDAELKDRKEYDKNELIVKLKGNEKFAERLMSFKADLYKTRRNFAEMIADAARYPKETRASHATQALAIGLELEWIREAYSNAVDEYRAQVPEAVEVNIGTWSGVLTDGRNEETLVESMIAHLNREERDALAAARMKTWQIACLIGGGVLAIIGIIALIVNFATHGDNGFMSGILAIVGVVATVYGLMARKAAVRRMHEIQEEYRQKRQTYTLVLRKVIAEFVDWRREFQKRDEKAEEVKKYLAEIKPVALIADQAQKYESR